MIEFREKNKYILYISILIIRTYKVNKVLKSH